MRTAEFEREAQEYDRIGACYMHVEMAPGSDHYTQIMSGDETRVVQAIYNLIGEFCTTYGKDPKQLLKFYLKAWKKFGLHKTYEEAL